MKLRPTVFLLLLLMAPALAGSSGSRHFAATPSYFHRGSAILTAYPLTIAAWYRLDTPTDALDHPICGIFRASGGTAGQFDGLWLDADNTNVVGRLFFYASHTTTFNQAESTAGISDTNWHFATAVATSATSRTVYLDGTNSATDATSITPSGMNETLIGAAADNSGAFSSGGAHSIADCAIWSAALTLAEVQQLAKGASPLSIRPGALVMFAPLWGLQSPEIDLVDHGHAWTAVGSPTVTASAPPVNIFPAHP